METLIIKNNGEIETQALVLMGASSKRGDATKIGMFGTGNKYAIATLVREGFHVHIASGNSPVIRVVTRKVKFRNKSYDQLFLKSRHAEHATSITTEMGLQWTVDHAMRELICNAVDEGGFEYSVETTQRPVRKRGQDSKTVVYITAPSKHSGYFAEYFSHFNSNYLFDRIPIYNNVKKGIRVFDKYGEGTRVYRNGVKVFESEQIESLFDYELESISIDELRRASQWSATWSLATALDDLPQHLVSRIVSGVEPGMLEWGVNIGTLSSAGMKKIIRSLEGKVVVTQHIYEDHAKFLADKECAIVPEDWYELLLAHDEVITAHSHIRKLRLSIIEEYELSALPDLLRSTLQKACEFLKDTDYYTPIEQIKVVDFSNPDNWGLYHDGEIHISRIGLERGLFDTIHTLLHEKLHGMSASKDETREFEDFIIRRLLVELQRVKGEVL